jgi:hypothetical protein
MTTGTSATISLEPSEVGSKGTQESAMTRLEEFMKARRSKPGGSDFGTFERELRERVMEVERELVAEELERADEDAPAVEIEGRTYRRVLASEGTYQTAAGPVKVMRHLYKDRSRAGTGRAVSPLELRVGMVEGRWTPHAAQTGAWVVAQLTPCTAEELFARVGTMTPSKSSLDRLPKGLSERWEESRETLEEEVRAPEAVPAEASTVVVSLDGVMAPMDDGKRGEKREEAALEGRLTRGPAGYREVGVGTVSFYDEAGDFLRAIRLGRMPETKKSTLKEMLRCELAAALAQRPELTLVKLADGAPDNWAFLSEALPDGIELVDFYHATEHLHAALAAVYGHGTLTTQTEMEVSRLLLREDEQGVEKLIRKLARLAKKHPKNKTLATELAYFRRYRHRMRYADHFHHQRPIGSGPVEAAAKTLVAQRMKLSGQRWSHDGGQAILTLRAWHQSDRFDRAWALLAAKYKAEVHSLANVLSLSDYVNS